MDRTAIPTAVVLTGLWLVAAPPTLAVGAFLVSAGATSLLLPAVAESAGY